MEHLTAPSIITPDFQQDFLLCYPAFVKASELLDLLIQRFNTPIPQEYEGDGHQTAMFSELILKPIRLK